MKQTTYYPIIGLETHIELKTNSKMFCSCPNDPFKAPQPNIYTCPVCLGMPGALPVANKKAIEMTIKIGLALHCQINLFSKFDRKHYFYPDLSKGYQISQYDIPFCHDGYVDTSEGRIRIHRIHLEEDTGKLLHTTVDDQKVSLIDFNRSGVPLVEIVTEADIWSASQAKEYGKKIRQLLRYLEVADCDMEQGGMRLEANISLSTDAKKPSDPGFVFPPYKTEIKNINSFRFLDQAITYEIARQTEILDSGKTPIQETRGFNSDKQTTYSQRTKESAEDYRYFPDPDMPPIALAQSLVDQIAAEIPKLPADIITELITKYELSTSTAELATESKKMAEWVMSLCETAQSNQVEGGKFINAVLNKKIPTQTGDDPNQVLQKYLATVQTNTVDDKKLSQVIAEILAQNPDVVTKYQAGKTAVVGFVVGQVMRQLHRGDVNQVRAAVELMLKQPI